jgi:hypothetical protein
VEAKWTTFRPALIQSEHFYYDTSMADVQNILTSGSWVMFQDAYNYCCQKGFNGIVFGQCQPSSLTFSGNQYAGTVCQRKFAPQDVHLRY